jgi:hypothetical protein
MLVLFLAGVGAGAVRLYRREPAAATGLAAGLAAWAIQTGLDWNWEMPAVTLQALLLAAAAIAWGERAEPAVAQPRIGRAVRRERGGESLRYRARTA